MYLSKASVNHITFCYHHQHHSYYYFPNIFHAFDCLFNKPDAVDLNKQPYDIIVLKMMLIQTIWKHYATVMDVTNAVDIKINAKFPSSFVDISEPATKCTSLICCN